MGESSDWEKIGTEVAQNLATNKDVQQAVLGGATAVGAAVLHGAGVVAAGVGAVLTSPVVIGVGLGAGAIWGIKKLGDWLDS